MSTRLSRTMSSVSLVLCLALSAGSVVWHERASSASARNRGPLDGWMLDVQDRSGLKQIADGGVNATKPNAAEIEETFWNTVKNGDDPALFEAYLDRFPDGAFSGPARAALERLKDANGQFKDGATADDSNRVGSTASTDPVKVREHLATAVENGSVTRSRDLAQALSARDPDADLAQLVLGLFAVLDGNFVSAEQHFTRSGDSAIGQLRSILLRAWTKLAQQDATAALELLVPQQQPNWAQDYVRYHRALIADAAGRLAVARTEYRNLFDRKSQSLRATLAYARHLAASDDREVALKELAKLRATMSESHPEIEDLYVRIERAEPAGLLITKPIEGIAEVLFGLGQSLSESAARKVGRIHIRLALFAVPEAPFPLAALAEAYEQDHRYVEALLAYEQIPPSAALKPASDIRMALILNKLDRTEEANAVLHKLAAADPADPRPLEVLGSIARAKKNYADAVSHFTRAIARVVKPSAVHWTYYYYRGASLDQLGRWPEAEADLKVALELAPEQPLVLNYLGYSWIDRNVNIQVAMKHIKRAAELKPEDPYIIDSLGWAYFKLGKTQEAIKHLERAVAKKPDEPIIRDHLADALWKLGQRTEARTHWEAALNLGASDEIARRVREKLARGGGNGR